MPSEDADIRGAADHLTTEAENAVTHLQAKGCSGLSEAARGKEGPRGFAGSLALPTLTRQRAGQGRKTNSSSYTTLGDHVTTCKPEEGSPQRDFFMLPYNFSYFFILIFKVFLSLLLLNYT